jgi:hypothetical protein
MSTNRRRFLIGAGLTGLSLAGGGKLLSDNLKSSDNLSPNYCIDLP